MKTRKLIVGILVFLTMVLSYAFLNTSEAVTTESMYVKIRRQREATVEWIAKNGTNVVEHSYKANYSYQLHPNNSNTKNVWKLYTTTGANGTTDTKAAPNLYCLRAGLGFINNSGAVDSEDAPAVEYTQALDMINDYNKIKELFAGKNTEVEIFDEDYVRNFNATMWILDNMLLEDATQEEIDNYLIAHGVYANRDELAKDFALYKANVLTKADIEAIQQLAIWYFTNTKDSNGNADTMYHPSNKELSYVYMNIENYTTIKGNAATLNTNGYVPLAETFKIPNLDGTGTFTNYGATRQVAAEKLYKYLIDTATSEATKLGNTIYKPQREIRVHINANDIPNQQPIVEVREKKGEVDVALRKFISSVSNDKGTKTYDRAPTVDTTKLNKNGVTTATYNHKKDPIPVQVGDIVTYTLRLYNEGDIDTRIQEVTDYLPPYLDYVGYGNDAGAWWKKTDSLGRVVITQDCTVTNVGGNIARSEVGKKLGEVVIPKAEYSPNTKDYKLSYVDIQISCKVMPKTPYDTNVTNIAQITKMTDTEGNILSKDRDSTPNDFLTLPEDGKLPDYTGGKNGKNDPQYDGSNVVKDPKDPNKEYYPGQEDDDDFEKIVINSPKVDLALRKFISKVESNGEEKTYDRAPTVDTSGLKAGADTAKYYHPKNPVEVKIGDTVTYTLRIYNEGEINGRVSEIKDHLAKNLELAASTDVNVPWTETKGEKYNLLTSTPNCKVVNVSPNMSETLKGTPIGDIVIPAYDKEKDILSYIDVEVRCLVLPVEVTTKITNIAEISQELKEDGTPIDKDRDSEPDKNLKLPEEDKLPDYTGGKNEKDDPYYDGSNAEKHPTDPDKEYYPGQEDDDDFEKLVVIVPEVDLSLRKFISSIDGKVLTGNDLREPVVKTEKLDKHTDTTADYIHTKTPIMVKKGSLVTYTIRVYNEGEINGYVSEITDYLPNYLIYQPNNEINKKYGWTYDSNTRQVKTTITAKDTIHLEGNSEDIYKDRENGRLLLAYDGKGKLDYIDVQIVCKVDEKALGNGILTNLAQITEETKEDGKPIIKDKDSEPNKNMVVPEDNKRPDYTGGKNGKNDPYYDGSNAINGYYPGQEDDDDFEKVLVKPDFDLALRKFITGVEDTPVNDRYPEVIYKDGKITYNHKKTPVDVNPNDTVIYTIRIFNEGEADGYANEITDDMRQGLEFLPDNQINKEYRWKMLDENQEETTNVKEAKYLISDYLSEDQEKATGRNNKIKAFNKSADISKQNPDYRDVKIAMKVTLVPTTKEETKRILVNVAQISKDSDDDIDSDPKRDEEYDPNGDNEDDIDYDNVKVKYFDLSLLKWVSHTRVTLDGKTVETNTGHTAETSKNEAPVKIEIEAKNLKKIVIKYVYQIQITNEGEIEGAATEIKDYIPAGLRFDAKDNTEWGWKVSSEGVVTTDYLKGKILKPGESATVPIVLTWINNSENLGEKVNLAEISKHYNKPGVPDIDSTPDNKKPGEDDIDDAPVILAVKTGSAQLYLGLVAIIVITLASGISLIKKYVL